MSKKKLQKQTTTENNAKLKPLATRALKYVDLRASVLKSCSALAAKFAKLRAPIQLKVVPQIVAAEKLADEMLALLAGLKGLFVEPKSVVLHGVKMGFRAKADVLLMLKDVTLDQVIEQIKTQHGTESTLLRVTTELDHAELKKLDADALKLLGLELCELKDEAFVTLSDGLEKLTKQLGVAA
jgi:hypothetical protein